MKCLDIGAGYAAAYSNQSMKRIFGADASTSHDHANGSCASLYVERRNVFIGAREPMTATPLDISEIRRRLEAAGERPVVIHGNRISQSSHGSGIYCSDGSGDRHKKAVKELQDHAPTDIAALLAEVERLQALLATAYEDAAKELKTAADDTIRAFILLTPESEHHMTLEQFAKAMDELAERIRALAAKNGAMR